MSNLKCEATVVLWIFLMFRAIQNDAQLPSFERLTIADGLSQGMIYDIEQTDDGFLWIATKDGLNRYDGYDFEVFTNDPFNPFSIAGNEVTSLFKDSRGNLWMSLAGKGLDVLEKQTGRFIHLETFEGVAGRLDVRNFSEAADGTIWIGTSEGLLKLQWKDDQNSSHDYTDLQAIAKVELVSSGPKPGVQIVDYVAVNPDGTLTVVMYDDGIYRFSPDDLLFTKLISSYGKLIHDQVNRRVWAITDDQFFALHNGRVSEINCPNHVPYNLTISPTGDLVWSSYIDNETFFFSLSFEEVIRTGSIANARFIYKVQGVGYCPSAKIDRTGILWVGTIGYGLQKTKLFVQPFQHFLNGHSISQIYYSDTIYLGLGGMTPLFGRFDEMTNSFSILPTLPTSIRQYFVSGNKVTYIVSDDAHLERLLIIKNGHIDEKSIEIKVNGYTPAVEDEEGTVWMGGQSARLMAVQASSGKLAYLDLTNLFGTETYITTLHIDPYQNLWVGTTNGMSRLKIGVTGDSHRGLNSDYFWSQSIPHQPDTSTIIYKTNPKEITSLRYNWVSSFCEDPDQPERYLWVSTKGGGLSRLDKSKGIFRHFTTKNSGLPNDVVYGILPDNQGNLWMSSNRGLSRMSMEGYTFQNFRESDGLQSDEFNTSAFARCRDGRLLFGGVNGLTAFYPSQIHERISDAPLAITRLKINNVTLNHQETGSPINRPINQMQHVVLSHKQNLVTLEFALMDFTTPQENRYRYQLKGVDPDWVETGTNHSANYTNLTPGQYEFEAQGSIGSNIWSAPTSLKITVLPPWWATWWAYVAYFLLFCIVAFGIFSFFRKRLLLQNQLQLEHEESKRLKELDSFKSRLFTNLTHEFRTPLTVILGMSQQLAIGDKGEEARTGGLKLIERNGKNLLRLINQLLDLSKLENQAFQLQLRQGNIVPYLRYVSESFQTYANSKNLSLRFFTNVESLIMDFDSEQMKQILTNLISNAVKFTPSGGEISIKLSTTNAQLGLEVKDTGSGINARDLPHIFDRFFQADNSTTRIGEGTGIGLAHTHELVKRMGGHISVESELNRGSRFFVTIPIHQNAEIFDSKMAYDAIVESPLEHHTSELVDFDIGLGQKDSTMPQILIIEDSADVVVYLKSCLKDEYQLDVAYNGRIGIEKALEHVPDLIISDVMMPEKDGYQVCETLKNDERTSHIPILLLTAKADSSSKMMGFRRGADAYLSKPFNLEELKVQLNVLINNQRRIAAHFSSVVKHGMEGLVKTPELAEAIEIEDVFMRKVKSIIEEHYKNEDFGLAQLCQKVGMSRSQLFRKMKAVSETAPSVLIRTFRLNKAKMLLQDDGLNVAEAAYQVGFKDPSYFSKIFREEFGVSPGATNK